MKKVLKRIKTEKGQGLTEYVLILAFIAGIAMLMFNGNSLDVSVKDTYDKINKVVRSLGGENAYAQRTSKWRQYKNDDELRANTTPEERLKSDQDLLISIGNMFLGEKLSDVEKMLAQYNQHIAYGTAEDPSGGYLWDHRTENTNPGDPTMKESRDVTLFEYRDPQNSDQQIQVLNNNNRDYTKAAELLTQGTVKASDFNSSLTANQRVFYSEDMIDQGYSRKLSANFGIDENTKEITSVHLYVVRGGGNNKTAINGMDLTVTKGGGVTYHNGVSY